MTREEASTVLELMLTTARTSLSETEAEAIRTAVDALKEQEAVTPTWNRGKPFCGACGLRIHGGKFCSECGRPIAWEGR